MIISIDTLFSATGYCVVRPIAVVAFGTERAMLLDKLYQLLHEPPADVDMMERGGRRYIRISAQWLRLRRSFWFWKPRNIQKHIAALVKARIIIQLPPEKGPDRRKWTALDNAKIEALAKEKLLKAIDEEGDFEIQTAMRTVVRMHAHSGAGHAHSRNREGAHSSAHLQYKEKRKHVHTHARAPSQDTRIALYRSLSEYIPNFVQEQEIVEAVPEGEIEQWRATLRRCFAAGMKPHSVDVAIREFQEPGSVYRNGAPESGNRNGKHPPGRTRGSSARSSSAAAQAESEFRGRESNIDKVKRAMAILHAQRAGNGNGN